MSNITVKKISNVNLNITKDKYKDKSYFKVLNELKKHTGWLY